MGKAIVGASVASLNYFCPDAADLTADVLKIGGNSAEIIGCLSDNKNLEKAGEILQTGAGLGMSGSRIHNNYTKFKKSEHANCVLDCGKNFVGNKKVNNTTDYLSDSIEIIKPFFK